MVNQGRKTTMISTTIIANTNKMIAEIQKLQPNWKKEQGKKKISINRMERIRMLYATSIHHILTCM